MFKGFQKLLTNPFENHSSEDFGVILLGTGTPIPSLIRACPSTLVIAGKKAFLIDTGRGFLNNLVQVGINVNMTLFTHFHSDHFAEFGEFMVTRLIWGSNVPMPVIGPKGTMQTIGNLMKSYELDFLYRKQHHGDNINENGFKTCIEEHEPGLVYDQDGVKITMFAVDHSPVEPAVGYKFEYNNQSIVISGDTKKVPIMEEMAHNADILVHEVLNETLLKIGQNMVKKRRNRLNPNIQGILKDIMTYHSFTIDVAEIAQKANVKTLVLTHLIPGLPPRRILNSFYVKDMKKIYNGRIIVGKDRMKVFVKKK
jgi:ribonuclease Z